MVRSHDLAFPEFSPKSNSYNDNNDEPSEKKSGHRLRSAMRCLRAKKENKSDDSCSLRVRNIFHIFRYLWSFSIIMLVILILALVLFGACVWLINYYVNRSGVKDLAVYDRQYLLMRVRDYVASQIEGGPSTVRSLAKRFEIGDTLGLDTSNQSSDTSRLATIGMLAATMKYSLLDALWYTSDNNYFTAVVHNSTNSRKRSGAFLLRTSEGDGDLVTRDIEIDTLKVGKEVTNVSRPYYPTERPFYFPFKQSLKTGWTPVYISTIQNNTLLVISISAPYLNPSDRSKVLGVFTATYRLGDISRFLETSKQYSEKRARTYIVQPDFILVGSSVGEVTSSSNTILNAANHSDFVVAESARYCMKRNLLSNLTSSHVKTDTFMTSDGRKRIVALISMKDQFGLDWTVITVSDPRDIFASVAKGNKISLIVSICIIAATVLLTIAVSSIIMRPLKRIYRELNKVTNMKFDKLKTDIHTFGLEEIDEMVRALVKMRHGLLNFARFVPSDVVKVLVKQNKIAQIGVVPRDVTVMFAKVYPLDYREQDHLANPKILVEMLQDLFSELSAAISEQSGIIDKYIGVTIMGLFNAPSRVESHELSAVTAAVEMQTRMEMLNDRWKSRDYPQFRLQIGINTSKCLVGNIGSTSRVSYTAVGDGVNVCSRLEGLNNRYHTRILIGCSTYRAVYSKFACRWISRVCVKGKTEPIDIYEVLCAKDAANQKTIRLCLLHDEVKLAIESNDLDQARYILALILEQNIEDYPARELYDRAMHPETFINCAYMTEK